MSRGNTEAQIHEKIKGILTWQKGSGMTDNAILNYYAEII